MSTSGYLLSAALVLLVVMQIRERTLDRRSMLLPLIAVGIAAESYLKTIPTQGNDVLLEAVCVAIGLAFGIGCAVTTHMRSGGDGTVLARAGATAATLWIVGIGFRVVFAFASDHGAGPSIERFSIAHSITSSDTWTAALVLMALAEVVSRVVVIGFRAYRLGGGASLLRPKAELAAG